MLDHGKILALTITRQGRMPPLPTSATMAGAGIRAGGAGGAMDMQARGGFVPPAKTDSQELTFHWLYQRVQGLVEHSI
ncbi:hypothetical protein [Stenotrophomonas maltophilia]|uniref:hypothetical protein n=1 Tax=Stenotrophomonas maltophilia TaxID=40324 RepID=UPI00215590CD|nr:hypothetical protein [Stenotrophomonas maltophilia]